MMLTRDQQAALDGFRLEALSHTQDILAENPKVSARIAETVGRVRVSVARVDQLREANTARLEAAIHKDACVYRCTCTVQRDALDRALEDLGV